MIFGLFGKATLHLQIIKKIITGYCSYDRRNFSSFKLKMYADCSTSVLTYGTIYVIFCKKVYNPTNNLPSYFGLFGETMRRSHLK